jgi:WD40 repeat protein/serine/threonine protein kinase
MLLCPFCQIEIDNDNLRAGRCPQCGSTVMWDEEGSSQQESVDELFTMASLPTPLPSGGRPDSEREPHHTEDPSADPGMGPRPRGNRLGEPVPGEPTAGDSPSTSGEVFPPRATIMSDTFVEKRDSQDINKTPPLAPFPDSDSPNATIEFPRGEESEQNSGGDANATPFSTLPPRSQDPDIGRTMPRRVDTHRSISVRSLTARQAKEVGELWRGTYSPSSSPYMTIKNSGVGSEQGAESVVVKTRVVRKSDQATYERPDYTLLEQIGEGGVGIVYAAKQTSINRTVAVKMLRPHAASDQDAREKFLAEAVVTGELDHPNIVPVYDLAADEKGAAFYSMKRVEGTPWSKVLKDKRLNENLDILMKVADAVAFAHDRNVVHRDLKPENIMLGNFGEVLVMDWGIALSTSAYLRHDSVTQSNSMGGTPAYMAPEMATGPLQLIGPRSDVYLLGALLFEILTGLTPHTGHDVLSCLQAAARNEIQPTDMEGELIAIAYQAMATDLDHRYQNVHEFQEAIRTYQSHSESIALVSRADEDLQNARKTQDYQDFSRALFAYQEALALWPENLRAAHGIEDTQLAYASTALSKGDVDLGLSLMDENHVSHRPLRRKLLAAQHERDLRKKVLQRFRRIAISLSVGIIVVLSVGLYVINNKQLEIQQTNEQLDAQNVKLTESERDLTLALTDAQIAKNRADDEAKAARLQEREARAQEQRAREQEQRALEQEQLAERTSYIAQIGLAAAQVEENAFLEARGVIDRFATGPRARWRHWEWGRLRFLGDRALRTEPAGARVERVAWTPDGRWLLVATAAREVRIWDAKTEQFLEESLELDGSVTALAVSPDGQWAATAASSRNTIQIWNLETLQRDVPEIPDSPLAEWTGHTNVIHNLRYSTDGRYLVSSSSDRTARLWDPETGESQRDPNDHSGTIWDAVISPDNRFVFTAGDDQNVGIWDLETGERRGRFFGHGGPVYALGVAWDESSSTSRVISAGKDRFVLVWDPDRVEEFDYDQLRRQFQAAMRSEFSNRNLRTAARSMNIQIEVLAGHTGEIRSVHVASDGKSVVTGGHDNTVRVWELEGDRSQANSDEHQTASSTVLRGHGGWVRSAIFHPVDGQVVSGGFDQQIKFWDVEHYAENLVLEDKNAPLLTLAYSPDGSRIVTAGRDKRAIIWDARTGQMISELEEGHEHLTSALSFFPPGDGRFATSAGDGTTIVWKHDSGAAQHHLRDTGQNSVVAVSADGRWVATGSSPNASGDRGTGVKLWPMDKETIPAEPIVLQGHLTPIMTACFLPRTDRMETLLFTGDEQGRGILWQYQPEDASWTLFRQLRNVRPGQRIVAARFLPDGSRLLVASEAGIITQWSLPEGEEVSEERLTVATGRIRLMELSPDGRHIALAYRQEEDRWGLAYWDLATRERIQEIFFSSDQNIFSLAFDLEQEDVIVTNNDDRNSIWRWNTATNSLTPYWKGRGLRAAVWVAAPLAETTELLTASGHSARKWNTQSGHRQQNYGPHNSITTACFSPDGTRVVTGGPDGTAKIWDLASQRVLLRTPPEHVMNGRAVTIHAAQFAPHPELFSAMVGQHPAEDVLVTAGRDGVCRFWAIRGDQVEITQVLEIEGRSPVLTIAFSPDGQNLVTGSEDGKIRVWNAQTGEQVSSLEHQRRRDATTRTRLPINHLSFSSDGSRLLSGGDDNSADLWDAMTWSHITRLEGHTAPVTSVDISLDLRRVLTASKDGTAKLWDTDTFSEVFTLKGHSEEVTAAKFSPDGRQVATAGADGTAIIWLADDIVPTIGMRRDPLVYRNPGEAEFIDPEAELGSPFARDFSQCQLRIRVIPSDDDSGPSSPDIFLEDDVIEQPGIKQQGGDPESDEVASVSDLPESEALEDTILLERLGVEPMYGPRHVLLFSEGQVMVVHSDTENAQPVTIATLRDQNNQGENNQEDVELCFDIHQSADRSMLELLLRRLTYAAEWKGQTPTGRRVIVELLCGDDVPEAEKPVPAERSIRFDVDSSLEIGPSTARNAPGLSNRLTQPH